MNTADAEEAVQDAIRLFLKRGGQADPANPKALLEALGSNINGIAVNRRRNRVDRAVRLTADGQGVEAPDSSPTAEQDLINDETSKKAVTALLERVDGDELATAIVMLMSDGIVEPADQAKALGQPVNEVYKARRRLKPHFEAVGQLMETW